MIEPIFWSYFILLFDLYLGYAFIRHSLKFNSQTEYLLDGEVPHGACQVQYSAVEVGTGYKGGISANW